MTDHNRNSALLLCIHYELAKIPAIGIDNLVLTVAFHFENFAFRPRAGQFGPLLSAIDRSGIVMAELDEHYVSRLQGIVDFIPATFVNEHSRTSSGYSMVLNRGYCRINIILKHTAPAPRRVFIRIFILDCAVSDSEHYGTAGSPAFAGDSIGRYRFKER